VLRRVALAIKPWLPPWTLLEPYLEDDSSYAPELVDVTSAPWRPESFSEGADVLADIATRGPFSLYTRRRDDGDYEIDVTKMLDHSVKEGFLTGGGRVMLRARNGRLVTPAFEASRAAVDARQGRHGRWYASSSLVGSARHEDGVTSALRAVIRMKGPGAAARLGALGLSPSPLSSH